MASLRRFPMVRDPKRRQHTLQWRASFIRRRTVEKQPLASHGRPTSAFRVPTSLAAKVALFHLHKLVGLSRPALTP